MIGGNVPQAGAPPAIRSMMPACCVPPDGMSSVFCSDSSRIQAVQAIDMYVHPPAYRRCARVLLLLAFLLVSS